MLQLCGGVRVLLSGYAVSRGAGVANSDPIDSMLLPATLSIQNLYLRQGGLLGRLKIPLDKL